MKGIIRTLLFAVLFIFFSCNKEEKKEDTEKGIDSSFIVGEWYRSYGNYVEDITFTKNLRFTGLVYENLTSKASVSDNMSGFWGIGSYGTVMSLDIFRTSTGRTETKDFSVVSWTDYSLQLLDKEYGNTESYLRIVENVNMRLNEIYEFDYLNKNSISASNYRSSNSSIISVNNNGQMTANDVGVAFINVSTNVGTLIVKVEVQ